MFSTACGEAESTWVVFTFDDVTTTHRTQRGLGVVRGLIDLHGGGMSATTNPGSATTVHITLSRHRVVASDTGGGTPGRAPKPG